MTESEPGNATETQFFKEIQNQSGRLRVNFHNILNAERWATTVSTFLSKFYQQQGETLLFHAYALAFPERFPKQDKNLFTEAVTKFFNENFSRQFKEAFKHRKTVNDLRISMGQSYKKTDVLGYAKGMSQIVLNLGMILRTTVLTRQHKTISTVFLHTFRELCIVFVHEFCHFLATNFEKDPIEKGHSVLWAYFCKLFGGSSRPCIEPYRIQADASMIRSWLQDNQKLGAMQNPFTLQLGDAYNVMDDNDREPMLVRGQVVHLSPFGDYCHFKITESKEEKRTGPQLQFIVVRNQTYLVPVYDNTLLFVRCSNLRVGNDFYAKHMVRKASSFDDKLPLRWHRPVELLTGVVNEYLEKVEQLLKNAFVIDYQDAAKGLKQGGGRCWWMSRAWQVELIDKETQFILFSNQLADKTHVYVKPLQREVYCFAGWLQLVGKRVAKSIRTQISEAQNVPVAHRQLMASESIQLNVYEFLSMLQYMGIDLCALPIRFSSQTRCPFLIQ